MARLSGLASEHHPEGPGDAPRRRRGRKSTPSVDLTANGKRPASPGEHATQTKRVKRVQLDDSQQLARELEDAVSRSSQAGCTTASNTHSEKNTRHNRRHSEPFVSLREEIDHIEQSPPPATQPLPGLTPHLNRVSASRGRPTNASRRARMSMPAQLQIHDLEQTNEHQFAPLSAVLDGRVRRRLRRSHLSEEVNEIEEHKKEDSKLRKAMADLRRELREKDKALGELNYQLEASRLGRIDMSDDQIEELEQKLEQANKEIDELKASSIYAASSREMSQSNQNRQVFDDDEDDDDFTSMLIDPEDLNITEEQLQVDPHPNGFYASRAVAMSSQVTFESLCTVSQTTYDSLAESSQANPAAVPDKISDQAVKRFESEFERLSEQLATSQGSLRIIAIELQNLHIIPPGASSNDIITALRHSFENARAELETMFPNSTIGLTNSELIHNMVRVVRDIMAELNTKVGIAENHNKNEKLLRVELDSVVDLLSQSEQKNRQWEMKWFKLDHENEEMQRQLVDLDDRVAVLTKATDDQTTLIRAKDVQIYGLKEEGEDKDTALQRLRNALDTYHADVYKLTTTVTKLEQQHTDTIARMEEEHVAVVQDLQMQLSTEIEGRESAEGEAQQKTEYIENLEARIGRLEGDIEEFTNQMTRLTELLEKETQKREKTEAERDEQETISYDFSNEIDNLRKHILDLELEVEEFRTNLDAERTQRVQTEASLDETNEQIDELTDNLKTTGLQANQLRSKLFEVQQEKEATITRLRDEAKEREGELRELLDSEMQRRETADDQVASLDVQCTKLQTNLTNLEISLEEMARDRDALEADRNDKIAHGNRQRDDLAKKLAALENSSASTITTLQANITDLTNDIAARRTTIQNLEDAAVQSNQEHTDMLADRDATIKGLNGELIAARDANNQLMRENKSLAKRVEDEAHELLSIMGAHAEESNGLRQAIAAKDATILTLQNNATLRANEYTEELTEKIQEIEELHIMGDNRAELIVELQNQINHLKECFQNAEADTRATMDALTESRRKLQEQNENLAAALIKRNSEALKAIREMKIKGLEVQTAGADLHKVSNGKITKVSEKIRVGKKKMGGMRKSRRQWDSGFGMDEHFEVDEGVDEALVEA